MIIPRMKPRENMKTLYDPTTPTLFCQGNQCQTLPPLSLLQSWVEIFLRGRDVTPYVMVLLNLYLITFIRGLIMH
jgi:hypothetical protein